MTVQGPVKKQQPDGVPHGGWQQYTAAHHIVAVKSTGSPEVPARPHGPSTLHWLSPHILSHPPPLFSPPPRTWGTTRGRGPRRSRSCQSNYRYWVNMLIRVATPMVLRQQSCLVDATAAVEWPWCCHIAARSLFLGL